MDMGVRKDMGIREFGSSIGGSKHKDVDTYM